MILLYVCNIHVFPTCAGFNEYILIEWSTCWLWCHKARYFDCGFPIEYNYQCIRHQATRWGESSLSPCMLSPSPLFLVSLFSLKPATPRARVRPFPGRIWTEWLPGALPILIQTSFRAWQLWFKVLSLPLPFFLSPPPPNDGSPISSFLPETNQALIHIQASAQCRPGVVDAGLSLCRRLAPPPVYFHLFHKNAVNPMLIRSFVLHCYTLLHWLHSTKACQF